MMVMMWRQFYSVAARGELSFFFVLVVAGAMSLRHFRSVELRRLQRGTTHAYMLYLHLSQDPVLKLPLSLSITSTTFPSAYIYILWE